MRGILLAAVALVLASCSTNGSATLSELQGKQAETDVYLSNVDAGLAGLEGATSGEHRDTVIAVRAELKKAAASHAEEMKLAAIAADKVAVTETKVEVLTSEVKETRKERNRLAAILAGMGIIAAVIAGAYLSKRFRWALPFP